MRCDAQTNLLGTFENVRGLPPNIPGTVEKVRGSPSNMLRFSFSFRKGRGLPVRLYVGSFGASTCCLNSYCEIIIHKSCSHPRNIIICFLSRLSILAGETRVGCVSSTWSSRVCWSAVRIAMERPRYHPPIHLCHQDRSRNTSFRSLYFPSILQPPTPPSPYLS